MQNTLEKAFTNNIEKILKEELLPKVNKPGQYLGNEFGSIHKDWNSAKSRMALIYPDLYELGMSNFGLKILYNIVNSHPDYMCDRAYAPMPDMEALLEEKDMPLWGWESFKALNEFDLLGFSLGYELCYTNILTMMNLCKIPFYSLERSHRDPLIFAGGPATHNPEIMAEYFDFYLIGDGEELITEIQESQLKSKAEFYEEYIEELKAQGIESHLWLKEAALNEQLSKDLREKILLDLAQIQGVYVPRFYTPDAQQNNMPVANREGVPEKVKKRITKNLGDFNQPTSGPVPHLETVQDKQVMEIRRGCDRGCRFCQVGYTYLPVRERSPEDLLRLSKEAVKNTGYEDYTLLSLSASDYTCLTDAARAMNNNHAEHGISLSMPSQRADRFNFQLADEVNQVRKSGLTLAPEAGTEKMRSIINKGLKEEEIQRSIRNAYMGGWKQVKLYFMIGLPFEEDSDLDGILDILSWSINMANEVRREERIHAKENDIENFKPKKPLSINCTISTFVPKSFTAFQWFSQCSSEEFHRKQKYLKDGLRARGLSRNIKLNCTEPELALIESVLSRGGREWGQVVKEVWDMGSRLDSWSEHFSIERWGKAAAKFNLDLNQEVMRHREPGSKQVWDVLDLGFTDKFLLDEWNQAIEACETAPCTENKCHACGVCFNLDVKNVVTQDMSDKNPFVTEIDVEKRKASCANFSHELDKTRELPISKEGLKIVVKNYEAKQKLRIIYSKTDDLRFISHMDFRRMLERALRRAAIPVVHSTGFNQRMKITWGAALPLFIESKWEYLELELAELWQNLENLKDILNNQLPKQARIVSIEDISQNENTSINKVLETKYKAIQQNNNGTVTQEDLVKFLEKESIEIEKVVKGKKRIRNIRENILGLNKISDKEIELVLKSSQRPDEILKELKPEISWKFIKTHQKLN